MFCLFNFITRSVILTNHKTRKAIWNVPYVSLHAKFLHGRDLSSTLWCFHSKKVLHRQSLSHRSHLSIHPSTSRPRGSSRTQACPAGRWCHYGYDRATEREHGDSWCPADWFSICGEETVRLLIACSCLIRSSNVKKSSSVVWPAPEVFCTLIAGEELGEQVDELPHLMLLGGGWPVGVIRCHGVQEGPGAAPQLFPVQRALRVLLWLWLCSSGLLENQADVFIQTCVEPHTAESIQKVNERERDRAACCIKWFMLMCGCFVDILHALNYKDDIKSFGPDGGRFFLHRGSKGPLTLQDETHFNNHGTLHHTITHFLKKL